MSPPAQQFLPVALPIMVTLVVSIWLASISQNKRLDDIVRRLERMEGKLDLHEERLVRVEERTSPLMVRQMEGSHRQFVHATKTW